MLTLRFDPLLRSAAEEVRRDVPGASVFVSYHPVGANTEWQGYLFSIDCLVPNWEDMPADQPDSVALCIGLRHITTAPEFEDAEVVWGHPSGQCEAEAAGLSLPALVDEKSIALIEVELPRLVAALKEALQRGGPRHPEQP